MRSAGHPTLPVGDSRRAGPPKENGRVLYHLQGSPLIRGATADPGAHVVSMRLTPRCRGHAGGNYAMASKRHTQATRRQVAGSRFRRNARRSDTCQVRARWLAPQKKPEHRPRGHGANPECFQRELRFPTPLACATRFAASSPCSGNIVFYRGCVRRPGLCAKVGTAVSLLLATVSFRARGGIFSARDRVITTVVASARAPLDFVLNAREPAQR